MGNLFWKDITSASKKKGANAMYPMRRYDYVGAMEHELTYQEFLFHLSKIDNDTIFEIFMPSEKIPILNVKLIMNKSGDAKLRCYIANKIEDEIIPVLYEKINHLNSRYRFVCLSIDEERDLCSAYDFFICGDEETAVKQIMRTMILFSDITDLCISKLYPLIWKEEEDKAQEKQKKNAVQDEGDEV